MSRLFLVTEERLLIIEAREKEENDWCVDEKLWGKTAQCVAADPFNETNLYCGTFGHGLWRTTDSGKTWGRVGQDSVPQQVTAVAVSSTEEKRTGTGVAYVGTEPSELYRSDDGGESWQTPGDLMTHLPSAGSWSFPPRPATHHVRHISVDPIKRGLIYVAIEAGALIRSFDGGRTWKDRVEGGPYDTHTLETNPTARGRLYSAAGDGYFESDDYGESWSRLVDGLKHRYLYSVAVHRDDPDTVLVSASSGPWTAYNPENAESYVYRKSADGGGNWQRAIAGFPSPSGTTISALSADPDSDAGSFYAANNKGVYLTTDGGLRWERLNVPWPESSEAQHVRGLTVLSD